MNRENTKEREREREREQKRQRERETEKRKKSKSMCHPIHCSYKNTNERFYSNKRKSC
jgi:hypothetical protein